MSVRAAPGTVLQVAHVVRDYRPAVDRWVSTLGAGPFFTLDITDTEQIYRGRVSPANFSVAVGVLGDTFIELVQPNDDSPSPFNEVLDQRGEGLHHYWLACDDFDAAVARYTADGHAQVGYGEMPGGMGRGTFFDTTAAIGCFVELLEMAPPLWAVVDKMKAIHAEWDGKDPIRPYPLP